MNERIKELAKRAGYNEDMFGVGHWDMPECQKLVELIVKECRLIVSENFHECNTAVKMDKIISKHFGVE